MKNKTLYLLLVLVFAVSQPAFAAFPVKHAPATTSSSEKTGEAAGTLTAKNKSVKASWLATHIPNVLHPLIKYLSPERRRSDTNGILSLIFGIVGLFPLYGVPFAITAIILGAIGRRHDEEFSRGGMILGIVGVILLVVEIILLAVVIATSI